MADTDYEDGEDAGNFDTQPEPTAQSRTSSPEAQDNTLSETRAKSASQEQASQNRSQQGNSQQQQQPGSQQGNSQQQQRPGTQQGNAQRQQRSGSPTHKRQGAKKQPPCNCRIDELARPKRWLILSTWKEHGLHFEPERSQALREKVQEEFFMTPEETAAYLAEDRKHRQKSRQNDRVRKAEQRKEAKAARQAADRFVQKRIKRGLIYAYKHPPPLLMSPMLRSISDKVLEELCVLHDVPVPRRGDTDKHSRYLISAADWAAVLTANIYYEVNVKEKEDIDRMLEADRCSYVDSDEGTVEKTQDKKTVKKEPEEKQQQKPIKQESAAPSEKQMGVTNYDNTPFDNTEEPEVDELDPIYEEEG